MTAQRQPIDYPRAPAHVAPYVSILGPTGAKEFLLAFGGSEIYLAANPMTRSMVVDMIGSTAARELSEALGAGGKVRVPTAKPWIAACMSAEGLKNAEIARRLHMSDTVIRNWLKRSVRGGADLDPRQLRLF